VTALSYIYLHLVSASCIKCVRTHQQYQRAQAKENYALPVVNVNHTVVTMVADKLVADKLRGQWLQEVYLSNWPTDNHGKITTTAFENSHGIFVPLLWQQVMHSQMFGG